MKNLAHFVEVIARQSCPGNFDTHCMLYNEHYKFPMMMMMMMMTSHAKTQNKSNSHF